MSVRFKVGDLVRFKIGGSIDWEVVQAKPHELYRSRQRLVLQSGMSERVMRTTSEHVALREEVVPNARPPRF